MENSNQNQTATGSFQIQQYVVFELDNEEYAVPILDVKEVIKFSEITPVPEALSWLSGIINLRGKVIPVLDLEQRFQFSHETKKRQRILVVEGEDRLPFGILVDEVQEVLKVTQNELKAVPKVINNKISPEFVQGVIVLDKPKERILLILNLKKILSEKEILSLEKI